MSKQPTHLHATEKRVEQWASEITGSLLRRRQVGRPLAIASTLVFLKITREVLNPDLKVLHVFMEDRWTDG